MTSNNEDNQHVSGMEGLSSRKDVVGLRIGRKTFFAKRDSAEELIDASGIIYGRWTIDVPMQYFAGFRLSDIPRGIAIRPVVERDGEWLTDHDVSIRHFESGHSCGCGRECQRRKYWVAEIGLEKFVEAMEIAINEREKKVGDVECYDLIDDDGYIVLRIFMRENMTIESVVHHISGIVTELEMRRDQIWADKVAGMKPWPDATPEEIERELQELRQADEAFYKYDI